MANSIESHEKFSDFKEAWSLHRSDMTMDEIFKEFVLPELIAGTVVQHAKGLWKEITSKWENELVMEVDDFEAMKEEDKAELERVLSMSEDEFDKYMADTRREAMMVIKRVVTNTLRDPNARLDAKDLKNIQGVFDAITKMMLQREELLLKKQKARTDFAMKALDLFGRYGGDIEALEKMKSIVYGERPNLSEGDVAVATVGGHVGDDSDQGDS